MSLPQEIHAQLPCQCTRHFTGEKPTIQRYCFCLTCDLSPDSNKCMCEACAYACHSDHKFCYGGTGPVVCACENCKCRDKAVSEVPFDDETAPTLPGDQPYRCTIGFTKDEFYLQHNYRCMTCKQAVGDGVCAVCARVCHAGHRLQDNGITPFYCDCGSGSIKGIKCRCNSSNPNEVFNPATVKVDDQNKAVCLPFTVPYKCTKTYGEGTEYVQHAFGCETCGVNEDQAFCEVCAQKCHSGHKLKDFKLLQFCCHCEKTDCKCDTEELLVPSLCADEGINQYNCGCELEAGEDDEEEDCHCDDDDE
ncbi:hypothetical protein TRFO_20674 [Tritrichomonas foetus]|uniref:UBR-type domain-containing protein n=1 Tax=Tritrichomonas foetus TaxID=1144522 RepID=A0A1J4KKC7_9EUKA|nr:hypothetical protein TRFO_20674 [Tritrichomonas foetus]|eukprot:OHT10134.1 hypothetical protein TRFO_20674 [Tritrichomonas foetus]